MHGVNDHPTLDDPLAWDELAAFDGVFYTGDDPRTLVAARRARVLVATARRLASVVASGVQVDVLAGSARDGGERYELRDLPVTAAPVRLDARGPTAAATSPRTAARGAGRPRRRRARSSTPTAPATSFMAALTLELARGRARDEALARAPRAPRRAPAHAPRRRAELIRHLYVHVPFCAHRCGYCDFVTVTGHADLRERYVGRACWPSSSRSAARLAPRARDGVPRRRHADAARRRRCSTACWTACRRRRELTVEANPETVDDELAAVLAARGVRVSLGAQSFGAAQLAVLERRATPEQVRAAAGAPARGRRRRTSRSTCSSACPGCGRAELDRDLDGALALEPEHLSCYELEAKPGHALHAPPRRRAGAPGRAARGSLRARDRAPRGGRATAGTRRPTSAATTAARSTTSPTGRAATTSASASARSPRSASSGAPTGPRWRASSTRSSRAAAPPRVDRAADAARARARAADARPAPRRAARDRRAGATRSTRTGSRAWPRSGCIERDGGTLPLTPPRAPARERRRLDRDRMSPEPPALPAPGGAAPARRRGLHRGRRARSARARSSSRARSSRRPRRCATSWPELEGLGMLDHPHTSAGRVPTTEGYRYYTALLERRGVEPRPLADRPQRRARRARLGAAPDGRGAGAGHGSAGGRLGALARHDRGAPRRAGAAAAAARHGRRDHGLGRRRQAPLRVRAGGRRGPRWSGPATTSTRRSSASGSARARCASGSPIPRSAPRGARHPGAPGARLHAARRRGLALPRRRRRPARRPARRRARVAARGRERARGAPASCWRRCATCSDSDRGWIRVGDDTVAPALRSLSLVAANYGIASRNLGTVALIGPQRMDYVGAMRAVRGAALALSDFVEEIYD